MAKREKSYQIAEMSYTKADAELLRTAIIKERDIALKETDFGRAITLSHIIAFMAVAIEQMWGKE